MPTDDLMMRHPRGVAGSLATLDPQVFGAATLDLVATKRAPAGAASSSSLHYESNGF